MSQDQQDNTGGRRPRRPRFEFYYYERVGDSYYLRITRFTIFVVIGVLAFVMIFLYFEERSGRRRSDINLNIGDPPGPRPDPLAPRLKVEPLPPTPVPIRQGPGDGTPGRRWCPSPTPTLAATPDDLPSPAPARTQTPPRPPN